MMRIALAVLATCFALTTAADEEMADYRHEVMEAIGGTMGAIGKILKQEVQRSEDLLPLANALDELAKTAKGLFPEGSEGGEALALIWEEPEDFAQRLVNIKEATTVFRATVATGDMAQIGPAVGNVGRACKGCHDRYRE